MSNIVQRVKNPMAFTANATSAPVSQNMPTQNNNSAVAVAASREIAEIQTRMQLAKMFPRDVIAATDEMLTQFQRPALASISMYQYARGGSDICELSIRAAEAMANAWGGLDVGWRIVEQKFDSSDCEAFAWDMQKNNRKVIQFNVPHYRCTKKGRYKLEDDRDIYELCANQASRRLRACILSMIPRDIQDAVKEQIQQTMTAHVDCSPERIKKMLGVFQKKFNVTKEMVEARIQRRIDTITPAQMISLVNIYNSIQDGMSKAEDWFDFPQKAENASAGSKLKAMAAEAAQTEKPEAETPKEPEQHVMTGNPDEEPPENFFANSEVDG